MVQRTPILDFFSHLILVIGVIVVFFPIYVTFIGSTQTAQQISSSNPISLLPGTNIVAGYEICAVAPNGAPDCAGASLALCKAKGFARGNSLDITSSFKCPAQMYREGRAPNPQDCRDESFVSKAVCQ